MGVFHNLSFPSRNSGDSQIDYTPRRSLYLNWLSTAQTIRGVIHCGFFYVVIHSVGFLWVSGLYLLSATAWWLVLSNHSMKLLQRNMTLMNCLGGWDILETCLFIMHKV